jgi:hypothetical protein
MQELAIAQDEGNDGAGFTGHFAASAGFRIVQCPGGFMDLPLKVGSDIVPVVQDA